MPSHTEGDVVPIHVCGLPEIGIRDSCPYFEMPGERLGHDKVTVSPCRADNSVRTFDTQCDPVADIVSRLTAESLRM